MPHSNKCSIVAGGAPGKQERDCPQRRKGLGVQPAKFISAIVVQTWASNQLIPDLQMKILILYQGVALGKQMTLKVGAMSKSIQ